MGFIFPETAVRCTASYFVKLYDDPVGFVTPPPNLRVCIVLFVAAEGWLLLDIGWFVVFLITMFVSKIVIGEDRHTSDRKTTLCLSWTQSFFWCSCDLRWLILNPLINLENEVAQYVEHWTAILETRVRSPVWGGTFRRLICALLHIQMESNWDVLLVCNCRHNGKRCDITKAFGNTDHARQTLFICTHHYPLSPDATGRIARSVIGQSTRYNIPTTTTTSGRLEVFMTNISFSKG